MSGKRRPPQARDRAIGAQLRSIREQQTTLSLEAAAALVQWSPATMSRTENGKRHISAEDVSAILAVYKVPLVQRDGLVARAKAIDEPGWWSRPLPGVPQELGALASYEAHAYGLTDWSVNIIPGLLQTYEYAKAYMIEEGTSLEDIEMVWMARLSRKQVLPKVEYTAYLGEGAMRTPFGGVDVLVAQLKHLIEVTERGIGVRMVPHHRPYSGLYHSWMLLEFRNSPPIAHVELLRGGVFLHDPEAVRYIEQRVKLDKIALSTTKTCDILGKLVAQGEGKR